MRDQIVQPPEVGLVQGGLEIGVEPLRRFVDRVGGALIGGFRGLLRLSVAQLAQHITDDGREFQPLFREGRVGIAGALAERLR